MLRCLDSQFSSYEEARMARIFDRKLAITYRWLQAVVLLGYLLGYKIGFQKVVCARIRTHTLGLRYARAPRVWRRLARRSWRGVVWTGELVRDRCDRCERRHTFNPRLQPAR